MSGLYLPSSLRTDILDAASNAGIRDEATLNFTVALMSKAISGVGGHKTDSTYLPLYSSLTKNLPMNVSQWNEMLGSPFDIMVEDLTLKAARGIKLKSPAPTPTFDQLHGSPQVSIIGKARRNGRAGKSRDVNGNNSTWSPDIRSRIPVQVDTLRDCIASGSLSEPEMGAAKFIFESSVGGLLPQTYTEASSGRQYADGISLQNVPKSIRRKALNGFEVDMVSAHLMLTLHEANRGGYEATALQQLANDPVAVRGQIAELLDADPGVVKEMLIALMYGAQMNGEIARIADRHELDREGLGSCGLLRDLSRDARRARQAIIQNATVSKRGIMNALGKAISPEATELQIYAHLMQGLEASILRSAVDGDGSVLSLEHDGFTTSREPDLDRLEQKVLGSTGIAVPFALKSEPISS